MPNLPSENYTLNLKKDVEQYIRAGEFEHAINLMQVYSLTDLSKIGNEVVLLSSRYQRLKNENRMGLITQDLFRIEQTKLENALLQLIDRLQLLTNLTTVDKQKVKLSAPLSNPDKKTLHKVIGVNNLKHISWVEECLEVSRSVCRVLTPKGVGTGFLVGPKLLLTNNHVLPTVELAKESFAEFNYQQTNSGKHMSAYRVPISAEIFKFSPIEELDFTLISIEETGQTYDCEPLLINASADPVPGEHVIVIQHPNGQFKQVTLTENRVVNLINPYLHYTTDTMPGSSGAPVFNDSWQVVALHRADGGIQKGPNGLSQYANEGVLLSEIFSQIEEYLE